MFKLASIAVAAALIAGCATSKNHAPKPSPTRQAYKDCLKRNANNKDACQKQRDNFLEQEEFNLLDESS